MCQLWHISKTNICLDQRRIWHHPWLTCLGRYGEHYHADKEQQSTGQGLLLSAKIYKCCPPASRGLHCSKGSAAWYGREPTFLRTRTMPSCGSYTNKVTKGSTRAPVGWPSRGPALSWGRLQHAHDRSLLTALNPRASLVFSTSWLTPAFESECYEYIW